MTTNGAFATGIATITNGGSADPGVVLDTWYPEPELGAASTTGTEILPDDDAALTGPAPEEGVIVLIGRGMTAEVLERSWRRFGA